MTNNVVHLNIGAKRETELDSAPEKPALRSERFFKLADDWYFTTRENVTMGPFESQEGAKSAVDNFVDFIKTASPKVVQVFLGDQTKRSGTA